MVSTVYEEDDALLPATRLSVALKEWAVAIRALREGRQIVLLRKGGILDAGGQFDVATRDVLLYPTYIHEEEQTGSLQPCYGSWMKEENVRRAPLESVRFDAWGRITDVILVRDYAALYTLSSQHIYSDAFLKYRIENEPNKPLYALFVRAYDLERAVTVPMEPDYYGCKSWIDLQSPFTVDEKRPAMSDHAYAERVRVTKRLLSSEPALAGRRPEMEH